MHADATCVPADPPFCTTLQVDLIRDKRFNFAGCTASDLVSHYMPPSTMRCVFEVRKLLHMPFA